MENANSRKPVNQESRQLTMRDVLAPLFRKRWAFLITFCTLFGLALLLAIFWASGYYTSTMQIVVGRERAEPSVTSLQGGADGNSKVVTIDEVASEVSLLQGRDILQDIVNTCNLIDETPSFFDRFDSRTPEARHAAKLESATRRLAKKIKVEAQKTSHVIDVKFAASGPPAKTGCVVQNLGKLYLEKHVRLQRPSGASEFFTQETDKYRQALDASELRLAGFAKSHGVASPEILRSDMAQQLVTAQAGLYQARQRIAADQQRLANIDKQMAVTPQRSATSEASISANILLEQMQSGLLTLELKRTQLLMKYDPSHPLVKEVEDEIAQTKEAIGHAQNANYVNKTTDRDPTYEFLRQDRARTEADLASEQANAAELSKTIGGMQSQLVNLDVKAVEQSALLREAKANEGNYLLYLNKREQERTSDALDRQSVANVAIAVPANIPVLPTYSPVFIGIVGFLLAFFAALGAAYTAEFLDPSFRTPDEVSQMLNVTVLAAVPKRVA